MCGGIATFRGTIICRLKSQKTERRDTAQLRLKYLREHVSELDPPSKTREAQRTRYLSPPCSLADRACFDPIRSRPPRLPAARIATTVSQ